MNNKQDSFKKTVKNCQNHTPNLWARQVTSTGSARDVPYADIHYYLQVIGLTTTLIYTFDFFAHTCTEHYLFIYRLRSAKAMSLGSCDAFLQHFLDVLQTHKTPRDINTERTQNSNYRMHSDSANL